MIKRISTIKNFGIYRSFEWNDSLKRNGRIVDFKKLNIIYGRNYSGKTTLFRIIRCLETGVKHNDYLLGNFSIQMDDDVETTELNLEKVSNCIRVFNKDFIKDNLAILFEDNGEISTFAILGEANVEVEKKIKIVREKLGSEDEGKGQYFKLQVTQDKFKDKKKNYDALSLSLEKKLREKAKKIKENRDFGVVTYNISNIKNDIRAVSDDKFVAPAEKEIKALEKVITETTKENVSTLSSVTVNLDEIYEKITFCVKSEVSATITINDLVNNKELQAWVKDGMIHHSERTTCAFCDNDLTSKSWDRLKNHFNKESEQLSSALEESASFLTRELKVLEEINIPPRSKFYSEFHARYDILQ